MFETMCEIVDKHLVPVEWNDDYVVFLLNDVTPITIGWHTLDPFMWATLADYLLALLD